MTVSSPYTVNTVLPATLETVAETVEMPPETPVAKPEALTVATAVADELHAAELVRFCVLPSEYVPVAVNCCVPPSKTAGVAGVTAMETRLAGGAPTNTTSTQ